MGCLPETGAQGGMPIYSNQLTITLALSWKSLVRVIVQNYFKLINHPIPCSRQQALTTPSINQTFDFLS